MMRAQRRPNPVFTPEYRVLVGKVIEARCRAGMSQRALAAELARSASHVARIECGQRRIDALELYFIAKALKIEPSDLYSAIATELDRLEVEAPA